MNTTTDNEWTMKLKTETYMNMNSTGDTLISTASVKKSSKSCVARQNSAINKR